MAYPSEQFQPFAGGEPVLITVRRDRSTGHVLHYEVRRAVWRGTGVENFGDGRVVHQGQSLALGFKARDDIAGVHPRFH